MRFARTAVTALVATSALGVMATAPATALTDNSSSVFVSEIHYDNDGTDIGEAIEVFGPANTDLTGWSIALYNGNGGAVYNTIDLSGTIPDEAGGVGVAAFETPGLQNGAPDGLALVDPIGVAVQFLSYEGVFTADGGPADDLTSTDIGVSEGSSTPIGSSLQLAGTGSCYGALEWTEPSPASFGSLGLITPDPSASCEDGGAGDGPPPVRFNEIHYDNDGTDAGEAIEVFGPAGTELAGWSIVLYNGSGGAAYSTTTLSGTITDLDSTGSGVVVVDYPTNGIQNGPPDGLALVDPSGTVVEFLSYEGVFIAAGGPADGLTSIDINVAEGSSTAKDQSLQRDNAGIWSGPRCASFGLLNDPNAPTTCPTPAVELPIWEVQGSGFESAYDGRRVIIDGYVVGDFQGDQSFDGFYVQEPTEPTETDGDPATSDGIFVFSTAVDVEVGQFVTVTGTVDEFFGRTEISSVESIMVSESDLTFPAPTLFELPANADDREALEGMLVTLPQTLVISEYFNFDQFGEIVLTTARQNQPTAVFYPGPEAQTLADDQTLNRIMLDDGRGTQNPDPARHPNGEEFTLDNRFRGGDTLANIVGVMDYSFRNYKIQPTQGADYTVENPRPTSVPEVGGTMKVASFNVLNYFNTIDSIPGSRNGPDICGPSFNQECRGANDPEERQRQLTKIVAAMAAIEADVYGINEVENTTGVEAMEDIVDGLNAIFGPGTYAYIDTGTIGTDAIKVGFIYRTEAAVPVGEYAILDTEADSRFIDDKNRPTLAQTFFDTSTGQEITLAVNHLKSKGSACDGDADAGDGQGNCNGTRTAAAEALADWLEKNPTGSVAPTMIIGDLNSYDMEDPILVLKDAGYTDLIFEWSGAEAYSYVFDGKVGYLDHALADETLVGSVTGAAEWHINADEPDILDYDTTYKKDAQDALYEPNEFRSSDHDPVLVGVAQELDADILISWVAEQVDLLGEGGSLNGGQTNALLRSLDRAATQLERGHDNGARGILSGVATQLRGFVDAGIVTSEEAAPLLHAVDSIVDALS